MRIEAYLRIVADENTIRSIHREANLPDASLKQSKAVKGSTGEVWWNWQTVRTPVNADNPDEGLKSLLQSHKVIFPIIKRHAASEMDVYLQVVSVYEEGEEPQGLYVSPETVRLLSEMGGALDNDVVVTTQKPRAR
jgi:hypothetical protein